tara:strand:- start:20 stop:493 length:474 start_codon:yes stop_codon:yes gene_type:complete
MNCVICKRELSGYQKKYCSRTCSEYIKAKIQHRKFAKELGKRTCDICGTVFRPIRRNNIVCSRKCLSKRNAQMRKAERLQFNYVKPLEFIQHTKPHFNKNCSENKSAIKAYLKTGGKITTLPTAPSGKSPDVNIKFGWIPNDLYGNGLLYEMDLEHE